MDVVATIEGLRHYTIHGEPYVIVYYSLQGDPNTFHHMQLSADALPGGLRVGEQVALTMVAGIVAGVRRIVENGG